MIFKKAYEELQREGKIITVDKLMNRMFVIRKRLDIQEKENEN